MLYIYLTNRLVSFEKSAIVEEPVVPDADGLFLAVGSHEFDEFRSFPDLEADLGAILQVNESM